jgi:hypothetical protein
LSWISGQLLQHGRGLDDAGSDRRSEAKDFIPVGRDVIGVDEPADKRGENWRRDGAGEQIQSAILDISQSRGKAEAQ